MVSVPPFLTLDSALSNPRLPAPLTIIFTVSLLVLLSPYCAVTVASPAAFALTTPSESTDAIAGLSQDQEIISVGSASPVLSITLY